MREIMQLLHQMFEKACCSALGVAIVVSLISTILFLYKMGGALLNYFVENE